MKYFVKHRLSDNISETPEGFLVCLAVPIARTGEQIYGAGETPLEAGADGKISIYRDEKEVFRPQTIASFNGKPITIKHPEDFVTTKNWSSLAKGIVQNARRGEGDQKNDLLADLLITDDEAIKLVKNGLREVSCGYEAEYEQTDDGKGMQTKIVGNHLALVDEGRAGSAYAIKDHKLKGDTEMSLTEKKSVLEKVKAIFSKAQDEAMKLADEAPEEKKKEEESKDAGAYDELVQMCKDLGEKIDALSKPKDEEPKKEEEKKASDEEEKDKPKDEEKKEESKDDEASMEDRLKALEEKVAKFLESQSKDEEKEEESKDADEESEDDDFEESSMVGDDKSRVEILAPGLEVTKDFKAEALKTAWKNAESKKVIETITGKKELVLDSAEKIDTLFVAASELLKVTRNRSMANTKKTTDTNLEVTPGYKTAEQMNEVFAQYYKRN